MVFHIQPVSDIFSVSVDRQFFPLQCIVDNQGNEFFRELIGTVIVGTVGNVGRKFISIHISPDQHIGRSLAGRIRAVGRIGRSLVKISAVLFQGTIHLIRRHMQKPFSLFICAIRIFPCLSGTVQHNRRTQHIGLYKHFRILNAPVHMTFRREMHHPVYIISGKNPGNCLFITDIGPDKDIVVTVFHFL